MRAPPEVVEAALILADELEEDGYLRVPLAEVASAAPAERRRGGRGAAAGAGLRSGRGGRARPRRSAWRCSCASATGSIRRCRRCSTTSRWWRAARIGELQALCGVDAEDLADMLAELRALDPKPGAALRAPRRSRSRCRTSRRRAARAAAGRSSSTPRRCRGCWSTTSTRRRLGRDAAARAFVSEMQRQRQLAGAQPRAAGAHHPQGRDRDRRSGRSGSSRSGSRELRPLTQRAVAGPARAARIDRQPGGGGQVPRLRRRAASSSASSSARRSRRSPAARRFRRGGAGAHPRRSSQARAGGARRCRTTKSSRC